MFKPRIGIRSIRPVFTRTFRITVKICNLSLCIFRITIKFCNLNINIFRITVKICNLSIYIFRITVKICNLSLYMFRITVKIWPYSFLSDCSVFYQTIGKSSFNIHVCLDTLGTKIVDTNLNWPDMVRRPTIFFRWEASSKLP